MNCVVTGSTGFVGSHILDKIAVLGWKATAVVRKGTHRDLLKAVDTVSVESEKKLAEILANTDYFFNVAGVLSAPNREDYLEGNWRFSRRMVSLCKLHSKNLKRFVHVSSLAAAGPSQDGLPVTEEMEPKPVSIYGMTKLYGEKEALAATANFPVTVIRPPVVFGPSDNGLLELFRLAKKGLFPVPTTARKLSMVYIDDLIESIFSTLGTEKTAGRVYFACLERMFTYDELHSIIGRCIGTRLRKVRVTPGTLYTAARLAELAGEFARVRTMFSVDKANEMIQRDWVCSARRLAADTGYASRHSPEEKMPHTLAWYEERGLL